MNLLTAFALATNFFALSDSIPEDRSHVIEMVEVVAPMKQSGGLFTQAVAGSSFSLRDLEAGRMTEPKELSLSTPNLFMPDYGSKMTSSIYVRGIGARMDQPSVGLYIDNVPVLNKNSYDMDFFDIIRVDVLRGPQGTLYGRNTIGGVINVYSLSPFEYTGLRAFAEYANANTYSVKAGWYARPSDKFGYSVSAYHHSSDGFFENEYDGAKTDGIRNTAARVRLQWKPSARWIVDNVSSFNTLRQDGFSYAYFDAPSGKRAEVNHNDPCYYDRDAFSNGTNLRYNNGRVEFSSTTSYQYLNDAMTLDQDFLPLSMFVLTQAQKEHAVTQEVMVRRADKDRKWQWLTGAFGFYKTIDMDAPVTFKKDGIEQLIVGNANAGMASGGVPGQIYVKEDLFEISSRFDMPAYGIAAFHQSSYRAGKWNFTAGIRFDYEHTAMRYDNDATINYTFRLHSQGVPGESDYTLLTSKMSDRVSNSFFSVLPRFSVLKEITAGNIYASVSRGYKAGGFNTQIFSDLLQSRMMDDMMNGLGAGMPSEDNYDSGKATAYDPEYSWNYEIGTHLSFLGGSLVAEAAVFYIGCKDQQITVFPAGKSTGRLMSNAGRSRSYGAELSAFYRLRDLRFDLSYGYTNAKFTEFDDGKEDFSGKYVPYVPAHTLYAGVEYNLSLGPGVVDNIRLRTDWRGAGKIYWNEDNSSRQSFYGILGASVAAGMGRFTFTVWGRNLSGKDYNTFYFKSIGNTFVQRGKPRQYGLSLAVNF